MQLTPLLISILLLVSSKLKPLKPFFQGSTQLLVSISQPLSKLKGKVNQQKLLITSLPSTYYTNLALQAEISQLKTQNLLLKNKLGLDDFKSPIYNTVSVRLIKIGQLLSATSDNIDLIKPGMPVIQSTNLIGLVQSIKFPIIYILPLTNKDISFPVQVDQDTIRGDYSYRDQLPQMTNITSQVVINQSSTIFTLPTEQIPEGLVIGEISQIITQPSDPIQRLEIKLSSTHHSLSDGSPTFIILQP